MIYGYSLHCSFSTNSIEFFAFWWLISTVLPSSSTLLYCHLWLYALLSTSKFFGHAIAICSINFIYWYFSDVCYNRQIIICSQFYEKDESDYIFRLRVQMRLTYNWSFVMWSCYSHLLFFFMQYLYIRWMVFKAMDRYMHIDM